MLSKKGVEIIEDEDFVLGDSDDVIDDDVELLCVKTEGESNV